MCNYKIKNETVLCFVELFKAGKSAILKNNVEFLKIPKLWLDVTVALDTTVRL